MSSYLSENIKIMPPKPNIFSQIKIKYNNVCEKMQMIQSVQTRISKICNDIKKINK